MIMILPFGHSPSVIKPSQAVRTAQRKRGVKVPWSRATILTLSFFKPYIKDTTATLKAFSGYFGLQAIEFFQMTITL